MTFNIYSLKSSDALTSITFHGENKYPGLIVICLYWILILFCFVVFCVYFACLFFFFLPGRAESNRERRYRKTV